MTLRKMGRTRKAKSQKEVIAFHSDGIGREAHPAIKVKVYHWPQLDVPEQTAETAYDQTIEQFWMDAQHIAHQHGYSGVFGEGRSSGWLVPFYQYQGSKLVQEMNWSGQGPDKGYPSYPDVYDAKERKRFVKFRADILELLANVGEYYKDAAKELTEVSQ